MPQLFLKDNRFPVYEPLPRLSLKIAIAINNSWSFIDYLKNHIACIVCIYIHKTK
jgi:hypothetical protein